jgi:DNA primase
MDYLEGRGISAALAETYRLGCVTDPLPGHDEYRGMLCIPYLTPAGPVALKFRQVGERLPKYLAAPNQGTRLYNVGAIRGGGTEIALCEGELDALILDGAAGIPAVGVPGAQNWRPFYRRVFEGYSKVYLFADNDKKEDGTNPGREMAKLISKSLSQTIVITMPPNTDVNDLYLQSGASALRELVGK